MLLVGGLDPARPIASRQTGGWVGPADRLGRAVRHLDHIRVPSRDRLPAHIGAHQGTVDVHHFALSNAGRDAGLDGAREDASEPLRAPALADARQVGMVRQRLGQPEAGESANGDIDRRLSHQPPVVHDAE